MELDSIFRALADPTRRRMMEELAERDGQTLFELHVRLINWHGVSLSRQALSKHLSALEEAGLVRTEWRWRSKHHYLERKPLRQLDDVWLRPLVYPSDSKENATDEDRAHERHG
jgi:DNA-binding transcriptional ArsR family regulator